MTTAEARRRRGRTEASRRTPEPVEIATGVHQLPTGRSRWASNVYLVTSGTGWVLVDAGWTGHQELIATAAESLFGTGAQPAAIVLTHIHPDHSGAAPELARRWGVPVWVHPDELLQARGKLLDEYANPLDRWLMRPLLKLLPPGTIQETDMTGVVRPFDPAGGVPGLPGWRWVPTPGHTPGHVALHRPEDGVLLTGDAVLTVDVNSVRGLLARAPRAGGPPWIATWDRPAAEAAIAVLAGLRPQVLGTGHGPPLMGPEAARQLADLAARCPVPATMQQTAPAQYRTVVATRAGGPEVLDVVSRRLRTPRQDEVRVRVEACSVSAVDVQARRGLSTYPPRFPFVPGYAVVRAVDAVGDRVTAVTPGDRVVVMTEKGGYAEYVYVDRHPLLRVPAGLDAGEVVAVALNYLVAHQVLSRTARIRPGQAVLITGAAGGIGTAIVQLGQLLGLRMYGADTAAKHPWLADHGVVPLGVSGEDVVEALRRLDPAGVDAVLDGVGGTWVDRGLAVLHPGGVLVAYANPGTPPATLRLIGRAVGRRLLPGGRRIRLYGTTSWRLDRRPLLAAWATLYELLEAGRIRPVIAGRLPLSEAARAHAMLESGDVVGTLVLLAPAPDTA
ncbi:MBL fold metallo-hydrolase [Kocuria sp. CPCC 205292]|uniref:MBL fold metallo-hydrolase n=1 Tax=Kocuria cellulosilytica TaxID=3071451 RepID=UPI0034D45A57